MLSHFSHDQLFVTLWTVAHQVPLSLGISSQEYWSGLPFPPPGDLPHPGIKLESLMSPALAGGFFTTSATWSLLRGINLSKIIALNVSSMTVTPKCTPAAQFSLPNPKLYLLTWLPLRCLVNIPNIKHNVQNWNPSLPSPPQNCNFSAFLLSLDGNSTPQSPLTFLFPWNPTSNLSGNAICSAFNFFFFFFLAEPRSMWDHSSLKSDQTHTCYSGSVKS